jgi:hypothetical protein
VRLRAFPVGILIWVLPSQAFAQPSEFSHSPNPAPASPAPAPPPAPPVPEKAAPAPAWSGGPVDANSSASPPVAGALPPAKTGSTKAPVVPDEPVLDPAVEAIADDPHLALGAGGHVAFGTAPAVAVGARVSAEVATGRWSLGIEGRYDLPAGAHTTQGGTARASLAGGSFIPCIRAKGTWACGVVMASRVTVDGSDANGATASDSWLFLGIGARFEMHLSLPANFALRIGGEILGHPIPYELTASGHRIFKSSVVSTMIGPSLVRAF